MGKFKKEVQKENQREKTLSSIMDFINYPLSNKHKTVINFEDKPELKEKFYCRQLEIDEEFEKFVKAVEEKHSIIINESTLVISDMEERTDFLAEEEKHEIAKKADKLMCKWSIDKVEEFYKESFHEKSKSELDLFINHIDQDWKYFSDQWDNIIKNFKKEEKVTQREGETLLGIACIYRLKHK